jgi:predicted nucleic acid-binding protein
LAAPLTVLDTMVAVGAAIGCRDASSALVVRAVATGDVRLAVSDEGYRELLKAMCYEDVRSKIKDPVQAFEVALDIETMGFFHYPRRYDWPTLPDPGDRWVLDLAYESKAEYIVTRDPHFLDNARSLERLGFTVLTPAQLLRRL